VGLDEIHTFGEILVYLLTTSSSMFAELKTLIFVLLFQKSGYGHAHNITIVLWPKACPFEKFN